MTVDLERQIRDYASHVTELSTPVDVERVRLKSPAEARRVPWHRRFEARWAAGLAAAAVILALIGGLALGYQLLAADEPPVITEPAPTPSTSLPAPTTTLPTTASTLSAGPDSPFSFSDLSWRQLSGQEDALATDVDQFMEAVTVGGPGVVAVGGACPAECWIGGPLYEFQYSGQGDSVAAVWVSTNGTDWSRVASDEQIFGGPGDQMMLDVVAGGPGLVAVGFDDHANLAGSRFPGMHMLDREGDLDLDGAMWTSVDGMTWHRLADEDRLWSGEGDQIIEAIAVGGPGLVAVGSDDGNAAVWVSSNGNAWSQITHDDDVFGGPSAYWMHDVAVGGPGLVAVGTDWNGGWTEQGAYPRAAVWTSENGLTWSRVPHDDAVFGGAEEVGLLTMWTVSVSEAGVVAGGDAGRLNRQALWVSADGLEWVRLDKATARPEYEQPPISGLLVTNTQVVAVGWVHSLFEFPDDRRRYERDLTNSTLDEAGQYEPRPTQGITPLTARRDAAQLGDQLISVGWTGEPCTQGHQAMCGTRPSQAAVWIADAP